jgi:magnesium-transporting ATPase (P-type)
MIWHALDADDVVRRLNTDAEKGFDAAEVAEHLKRYGKNRLPEAAKRGPFMRFLLQFNNVLVYVLLAAGFVKLMTNLRLDVSIILGVVLINALLGFIQEGRAEKALDSIRNMLSAEARMVRGGEKGHGPTASKSSRCQRTSMPDAALRRLASPIAHPDTSTPTTSNPARARARACI